MSPGDQLEVSRIPTLGKIKELADAAVRNRDDPLNPGRLIIIIGGAGVGKTEVLRQAKAYCRGDSFRVTEVIDVHEVIDGRKSVVSSIEDRLRQAICTCAGTEIVGHDLADVSGKMQSEIRLSGPLLVLFDNLESLGSPPMELAPRARQDGVYAIKNHLIRPLLQLQEVPVVIVSAVRDCSKEKEPRFAWLAGQIYEDALEFVRLENAKSDVAMFISNSDVQHADNCVPALSLARAPRPWTARTIKILIDTMLDREPGQDRRWYRKLLARLACGSEVLDRAAVEAAGDNITGLPSPLRKRIIGRLLGTGLLGVDGTNYFVYPPLRNLLRWTP